GGSSSTQTVVVTLAEDDEYINITKSTSASYCATLNILGDSKMDTGGNSAEYYLNQPNYPCFTVTALTTAPDNHMVTVTATMTDKYNNVWIDEFEIEIVPTGAKLIVDGIKISGDGSLNKGESVKFNVGIYNEGTSSTQSVVTTLATDDDYVTVVKNISGCSNISLSSGGKIDTAGYTGSSYLNYLVYPCFTAIALGTTPDNHIATVTAIMTDKYNNVWTDDFEMMVLP
ncbi:MAG: hypothetical protein LBV09_03425, partial [Deferribacteraceae bacterium]|nr:hypothetical protein [Deferribacteraceae bacterium]